MLFNQLDKIISFLIRLNFLLLRLLTIKNFDHICFCEKRCIKTKVNILKGFRVLKYKNFFFKFINQFFLKTFLV